ncbi:MAG: hypothetical protein LUQ15_05135 [Methanothrix sp.]|nr:hypothetical protein [Methanothrix sp.]OYV10568.1 MAG: hypothetical protein CG437_209 [Methanosaeta sp. NSP1]
MKIALTMALLLVLSISLSSAITYSMEGTQENINSYNSKIDNAPDILKRLVGNEKINIDVIRNDGSVFRVGFVMENARINQTVEGGFSDASIILTTTENAVNTIRSSDNPIDTFQKQEDLGQVRIEGDNLLTKAKLSVVFSSSVLQFFSNVFYG